MRVYYSNLRQEMLSAYGTSCRRCGSSKDLELDHTNGDGYEHRAEVGYNRHDVHSTWADAKKRGFPAGLFQTLCHECHVAKGEHGRSSRTMQVAFA